MIRLLLLVALVASPLHAFTLGIDKKIEAEGFVITRAELTHYLSNGGALRSASYRTLAAAPGDSYLVLRFRSPDGGHIWGEVDAVIDGKKKIRQRILLHFAKDWVEYFVPESKSAWRPDSDAIPHVSFEWDWLRQK